MGRYGRLAMIAGCCIATATGAFAQANGAKPQAGAAAPVCGVDHRTYTGGRCFPDAGVAPVAGSACKVADAKGNPIGGIIVKGGRCMAVAPPTGPSKGISEKGIK